MIAPGPLKFLQITNSFGESFPLWGDDVHFVSIDGTGMPPLRNMLERTPRQYGATQMGSWADARRMVLTLYLEGVDTSHTDRLRDRLVKIFSPVMGQLTLTITREDNLVREIDCFVDGEMDFPTTERSGSGQLVIVPLVAPDPIWRDPIVHHVVAGKGTFTLIAPMSVEGTTWFSVPTVDITGPLVASSQVVFEPGIRGIYLDVGIPDAETWRFIFDPRAPTVRRVSDNANMFSALRLDIFAGIPFMQLDTMVVLSGRETKLIESGRITNDLVVLSGSALGANSHATISWQKRYASL